MQERREARGTLRIAAHPFALEAGLPQLVKKYREISPRVQVFLTTQTSPLHLEHGQYDVAICPPDLVMDADAVCRNILTSPVVLVASKRYLSQRNFNLGNTDLTDHIFLCCRDDTELEKELQIDYAGSTISLANTNLRMNVCESRAVNLALSGFGMALLPEILVAQHISDMNLQHVFPESRVICKPAALSIAYMRHKTVPHRTRSFVEECKTYFLSRQNRDAGAPIELAA